MKFRFLAVLRLSIVCFFFSSHPLQAQSESEVVSYLSHGYFDGLILADSLLIQDTVIITVSHNKIEMFRVDVLDSEKKELFFESRFYIKLKIDYAQENFTLFEFVQSDCCY